MSQELILSAGLPTACLIRVIFAKSDMSVRLPHHADGFFSI